MVVFLGTLLLAAFLVANGVYILMRGRIGPHVVKPPASGKVLPYWSRFIVASFYFALATGLVILALQFRMT